MKLHQLLPIAALGIAAASAANALPVTFQIDLVSSATTGTGTIIIDDSLIAPNAYVPTVNTAVSISFAGLTFDTTFAPSSENWVFDAAGYNITAVEDTLGNYVDFSVGGFSPYLELIDGPVGTFQTFAIPGASYSGTYTITRLTDLPAVPLPATLPLLLAGVGGFTVLRKRKPKAA